MSAWWWYVARSDELMLDVDARVGRGLRGEGRSRLGPTRRRLRAAVDANLLDVKKVYVYRSLTPAHFHVVVKLAHAMQDIERFVWEMQLRGDLHRGRCNIMRVLYAVPAPGLLISPKPWPNFERLPDAMCACSRKHDFDVMQECGALKNLRGPGGGRGFFGKLGECPRFATLLGVEGPVDLAAFLGYTSGR